MKHHHGDSRQQTRESLFDFKNSHIYRLIKRHKQSPFMCLNNDILLVWEGLAVNKKLGIGILTIVLILGIVNIALAQGSTSPNKWCPFQQDEKPKQEQVKNSYPNGYGPHHHGENHQYKQQRHHNPGANGSPNECPYNHNPQRTR